MNVEITHNKASNLHYGFGGSDDSRKPLRTCVFYLPRWSQCVLFNIGVSVALDTSPHLRSLPDLGTVFRGLHEPISLSGVAFGATEATPRFKLWMALQETLRSARRTG